MNLFKLFFTYLLPFSLHGVKHTLHIRDENGNLTAPHVRSDVSGEFSQATKLSIFTAGLVTTTLGAFYVSRGAGTFVRGIREGARALKAQAEGDIITGTVMGSIGSGTMNYTDKIAERMGPTYSMDQKKK